MKGKHARVQAINKLLQDERTHPRLKGFFILLNCIYGSESDTEQEFYTKCVESLFLDKRGIRTEPGEESIETTSETKELKSALASMFGLTGGSNVQSGESGG